MGGGSDPSGLGWDKGVTHTILIALQIDLETDKCLAMNSSYSSLVEAFKYSEYIHIQGIYEFTILLSR